MAILIPILYPILFLPAVGVSLMEVVTGNIAIESGFCAFMELVFNTLSVWL